MVDAQPPHARLGHVCDVSTIAQQQGITFGGELGASLAYERGKALTSPVKRYREQRMVERVEQVHTDVARPFDACFERTRYAICFVDNYSQMRTIYALPCTLKAMRILQQFKRQIEKTSRLRTQRLWSDQGQEIAWDDFRTYRGESDTKNKLSAA